MIIVGSNFPDRDRTERNRRIIEMLESETFIIPDGQKVEKINGYRWPGVVVCSFRTLKGELRYVVECTVPEVAGALHIYAPGQIRSVD